MRYTKHVTKPKTAKTESLPQTVKDPGSPQVKNNAGGFVFKVDQWDMFDRFLVLGSEGGTYYASEKKLTVENAKNALKCLKEDGAKFINRVVEISDQGRAPKNDPALFALALAAKKGDEATKRLVREALPKVARIGTHLFHYAQMIEDLGGWGRGTMRAFKDWYGNKPADKLAFQAVKYQSRDGWSHRDVLRKTHPVPVDEQRKAIYHWMTQGWESVGEVPHPDKDLWLIWAFERAKPLKDKKDVPALIELVTTYGLPHECIPTEMKNFPEVWEALLEHMGTTAVIRNLAKMTNVGLLKPTSAATKKVIEQLGDVDILKKARIHPLNVLTALKTYSQGHGDKGKMEWSPVPKLVDALDKAFYLAFKAVEPTGKRICFALDVSGSMSSPRLAGVNITPREGSSAMALVSMNVEDTYEIVGFTSGGAAHGFGAGRPLTRLSISPRQRLDDVCRYTASLDFGGTDCALPMVWCKENNIDIDLFCIYTDTETWAGDVKPHTALEQYRQARGIGAKMVVVGMTSTGFSIADPSDAGMLDCVGFDSATPSIISDFATV
jgi:60 kDa SS-A/Ro ribonucleoprotein